MGAVMNKSRTLFGQMIDPDDHTLEHYSVVDSAPAPLSDLSVQNNGQFYNDDHGQDDDQDDDAVATNGANGSRWQVGGVAAAATDAIRNVPLPSLDKLTTSMKSAATTVATTLGVAPAPTRGFRGYRDNGDDATTNDGADDNVICARNNDDCTEVIRMTHE